MAEDSVTSSEEHDGVERSEEEEEDVDLDTLPGWTGWMSTKGSPARMDWMDEYKKGPPARMDWMDIHLRNIH